MNPPLRARLAAWVRRHVVADNPDQGRSGWDNLDHVERPDDDGSVTDATDRDCG